MLLITIICCFELLPVRTSSALAMTIHKDSFQKIDEEITQNMQRFNIPGMAFVLADENGTVYSKGYGVLKQDSALKVNTSTNFHIGSISKVFTSLAIMQLRDAELIQLNDPVTKYLPWFTTKDPILSSRITIRDLLNHTSGLPGRLNTHDITGASSETIRQQLSRKLQNVSLVAEPGITYEYSNINYDLLQLIIEEVSALSFPDYMSQQIFQPLGMKRTFFNQDDELEPNSATGHRYLWGNLRPFHENLTYATLGSAGLSTNAKDLGIYISFLSAASDDSVLQSNSLREMRSAAIYDSSSIGYGYGWEMTRNTIEKKGGLPGFTANLIIVPGKSYGFALLANSKQNITDETNFNIYRILEGDSPIHLAKADYPAISPINKSLLYISGLLILIVLLMWLPTLIGCLAKKGGCFLIKPTTATILICFVLNIIINLGVQYYIYVYVPFASGAPSLYRFTTAPDTVNGLTLLSIAWLVFSTSVVCKSVVRVNAKVPHRFKKPAKSIIPPRQ
ncbi:serine hydrolase domain-containing protein [Paenibacillus sp. YSY-4.3]